MREIGLSPGVQSMFCGPGSSSSTRSAWMPRHSPSCWLGPSRFLHSPADSTTTQTWPVARVHQLNMAVVSKGHHYKENTHNESVWRFCRGPPESNWLVTVDPRHTFPSTDTGVLHSLPQVTRVIVTFTLSDRF